MKHATSRLLFGYWDKLRGDRPAPDRGDVEPGLIRHLLADTFILAAEPDHPPTFRLAGTRCSALFGRDLKDVAFRSLWSEVAREGADELVAAVLSDGAGIVAGLRGETGGDGSLALEMLLLPLRHRGSARSRILGAMSPVSAPAWHGETTIDRLSTGSWRTIGVSRVPISAPKPRDQAAERRAGFVVVNGGLAPRS